MTVKGTDGAESINMSSHEVAEDAALLGDVSDIESLSPGGVRSATKNPKKKREMVWKLLHKKQLMELNVKAIFKFGAVISEG